MNKKKALSASLAIASVCSIAAGVAVFAAENDSTVSEISMENSFIRLSVEGDSQQGEYLRYRLDATGGQTVTTDDDNKNLTYQNFFSGYTTININGQNYVYGRGTDVSAPAFNASEKSHTSSQKFGDVVIEQKLSFAEGFTPGYEDILKISYHVVSAGENDTIGVRILIDPMLDNDDSVQLDVNDVTVKNESVFNENLPKEWSAAQNDNLKVSAFGKLDGVSVSPDSVTFANWDSSYDSVWEYAPDINKLIKDAAVCVKWNPVSGAADTEFTTYYGIKNGANIGRSNKVTLSSPKTSSAVPVGSIALGAVSLLTAAGCAIVSRKEIKDEK